MKRKNLSNGHSHGNIHVFVLQKAQNSREKILLNFIKTNHIDFEFECE